MICGLGLFDFAAVADVHRWWQIQAMGADIPTITVDCTGVTSVDDVWSRFLEAAQPDEPGFGRNLDAFWDAIEGGGPGWRGKCNVLFLGAASLASLRTEAGDSFLNKLQEIAHEATQLKIELR